MLLGDIQKSCVSKGFIILRSLMIESCKVAGPKTHGVGKVIFFCICSLSIMCIMVVGCHWGPVILTTARIVSLRPRRSPYSHCVWVPLRPSDSDFSQNWKPGTGEWYPLLSVWMGTIEAQWFRLQPEMEAQDQGVSPTLTAVGHHWGPVILTSARIGRPGPGRFHYSHCGWAPLRPSDSDFSQNWKPGTRQILLLSLWLGMTEAQWFWLQPELEARDRGDSPTLTLVGHDWGPVILTSARIGSPGPGRFPYSFQMIPRSLLGSEVLSPWVTVLLSYHNARLLTLPQIGQHYWRNSHHNQVGVVDVNHEWTETYLRHIKLVYFVYWTTSVPKIHHQIPWKVNPDSHAKDTSPNAPGHDAISAVSRHRATSRQLMAWCYGLVTSIQQGEHSSCCFPLYDRAEYY
jgi:hypothetical protein